MARLRPPEHRSSCAVARGCRHALAFQPPAAGVGRALALLLLRLLLLPRLGAAEAGAAAEAKATPAPGLAVAAEGGDRGAAPAAPGVAPPSAASNASSAAGAGGGASGGDDGWWAGFKAAVVRWLEALKYLRSYGWPGYVAALLGNAVLTVVLFPPFEAAVGWTSLMICVVYGFSMGFANIWLSKTGGSVVAFFLFRRVGQSRGWDVPEILKSKVRLMHERPWATIVPLYFFSPPPLSPWVMNYGLALCGVPMLPFAVGAGVTFLPPCLLEAVIGSSSTSLVEAMGVDSSDKLREMLAKIPLSAIAAVILACMAIPPLAFLYFRLQRSRGDVAAE